MAAALEKGIMADIKEIGSEPRTLPINPSHSPGHGLNCIPGKQSPGVKAALRENDCPLLPP